MHAFFKTTVHSCSTLLATVLALSGCASEAEDAPSLSKDSLSAPISTTRAPMSCDDFAAGIGNGTIGNCTTLIPGRYYMCVQGNEFVFNRVDGYGHNDCWRETMY